MPGGKGVGREDIKTVPGIKRMVKKAPDPEAETLKTHHRNREGQDARSTFTDTDERVHTGEDR